jgi:hypothetical protein
MTDIHGHAMFDGVLVLGDIHLIDNWGFAAFKQLREQPFLLSA